MRAVKVVTSVAAAEEVEEESHRLVLALGQGRRWVVASVGSKNHLAVATRISDQGQSFPSWREVLMARGTSKR